jgi:hypothetical protein
VSTEYWASEDEADQLAADARERERTESSLLDLTGVTSHRPRSEIERDRWLAGQEMSELLRQGGLNELSSKLGFCHNHQTIAQCNGCSKIVAFWNRCDIFWCPQCSPRLSKKRIDGLMFFVDKMTRTKHLVLTLKNTPRLTAAYLQWARECLAKFRRRKIFRSATAGLWAMEITNEGNGWHVHFHLVVDCAWLPVREVSEQWAQVCGDGSKIVWIEDASRGGLKANLPEYVTKYCGKGFRPESWTSEQLCEFAEAVKDGRTFGVFGALLGARREWREWLKINSANKKKCACGSCDKTYHSTDSYAWYQMMREGRGERPPPQETRHGSYQPELALGHSAWT